MGITSIGWALVTEGENARIIKAGVRVIPLSGEEIRSFEKGKSITTNADRTLKRSARINLQRYKLRREALIDLLIKNEWMTNETILAETGNHSTFETYRLRAKAVTEKIELAELARVLLMINKKRGYKSSRKVKSEDEGTAIDGMKIAMQLYEEGITPGQLVHARYEEGKKVMPDFYRSDLQKEFDRIWEFQQPFNSELVTPQHYELLAGKPKSVTAAMLRKLGYDGVELKGNPGEKKKQRYALRAKALTEPCTPGELSEIFREINSNIDDASGYLGEISDRSKELKFNKLTVGQYQYKLIQESPQASLKNQVFYRQDYMDEFEVIWEKQRTFYPAVLTDSLKSDVRDIAIFFQRPLKSQKGLLSTCELESKTVELEMEGKKKTKIIGPKVIPRSSPLFQEFKIWSQLNNIVVAEENERAGTPLELEEKQLLFAELNWKQKLPAAEILKMLGFPKGSRINFDYIDGNRTNAAIVQSLDRLFTKHGYEDLNLSGLGTEQLFATILPIMQSLGIQTEILSFDAELTGKELEQQLSYQFWHLLYAFEGDNSPSGIDALRAALTRKFGFPEETSAVIAHTVLPKDYGSLSAKAIKKILPFLKDGSGYSLACEYAGYNHSHFETSEDLDRKIYKDILDLLPKNSLRNPVVEKILNQMIHAVNELVATYGKPDEIRLEMSRELKKSAKERADATTAIRKTTDEHEKLKKELQKEFGLSHVSRNDLIRYKLFLELKDNGFRTLYSNVPIERAKLFSAEYDIEHIIPQARLFDNSFSNKTLELSSVNRKKDKATAYDFVLAEYGEDGLAQYRERVKALFGNQLGKKTKHRKLLMTIADIPKDFIERELRDTQYIAKKARQILLELVRTVNTTTGSITARLREDWQLTDVLKELNWNKYESMGLTEQVTNRHGQQTSRIKGWSKRNDHRHHAMDAITVAFTKPAIVQYLNNMNAKSDRSGAIYGIRANETELDHTLKRRFKPPMPINEFKASVKEHLEQVLVSFKAKNKVSTRNKNGIKTGNGTKETIVATPRGQLHMETVYGKLGWSRIRLSKKISKKEIDAVRDPKLKTFLEQHIKAHGSISRAFSEDNLQTLTYNGKNLREVTVGIPCYTQRIDVQNYFTDPQKTVSAKEKALESVIDLRIREILTNRYLAAGKDFKKAFSNLDEHPVWMNEELKICIRRTTITGKSNVVALHKKKDHLGKLILDENGNPIPTDFVATGLNHHAAIFRDEKERMQDEVKSFMEVVERQNQGQTAIDYTFKANEGWQFLFTLKRNECFVFPNDKTGFDPSAIDLLNPENYRLISPNLFRVRNLSKVSYGNTVVRCYEFSHHLETTINDIPALKGITYHKLKSLAMLGRIVKVRLNHLGNIVHIGE